MHAKSLALRGFFIAQIPYESLKMSQSIAIMVLGSPYANTSTQTALNFSKTVLESGQKIERLFFYHEAAYIGSDLTIASQDEQNLPEAWQHFIKENNLDSVVCIASGLKRGIIDEPEAKRYEKPQHSLNKSIELAGLGQWVDAVNTADKHIIFGN